MHIRRATDDDRPELVPLVATFRVALASFRGVTKSPDEKAAAEELQDYGMMDFPVFVAVDESGIAGYLLCRVNENVVWAEHLFVAPEHRRKGLASALYAEAERLVEELGGRTLYNWIHPNNDAIVQFLKSRGYDVLNLVEVRKAVAGESVDGTLRVGKHEFRY